MIKEETVKRIKKFKDDRNFDQFHSPANLVKSISIEANELLECFQWDEVNFNMEDVKDEIADVAVYLVDLCLKLNLDLDEVINRKMDKNEAKYPIEKSYGKATKYDKL